jgi:hypothetical protein
MAFLMKLFVDRSPDLPGLIDAVYELPVDVVFLAMTFAAASCISKPSQAGIGLEHFMVYVLLAIVTIFIYRRSSHLFDADKYVKSGFLAMLSFPIAFATLIDSVKLVSAK